LFAGPEPTIARGGRVHRIRGFVAGTARRLALRRGTAGDAGSAPRAIPLEKPERPCAACVPAPVGNRGPNAPSRTHAPAEPRRPAIATTRPPAAILRSGETHGEAPWTRSW